MADTKPEKPKSARKVIITCAVTGSVHAPTMTPHLPITPDQIARESIAAAEAGASIIHLHAPRPERRAADAECRCLHAVPAASSNPAMRSSTLPPTGRSA